MKTTEFLSKYEPYFYALLRIIAGFLFLWHGSQKLFDFPSHGGYVLPWYSFYIAGPIEFFGGVMIMTGFFSRWAAFIASGEMAVAYWWMHGPHSILPLVNHGELAILYCFLFLFIFVKGSGDFSIDRFLGKKKPRIFTA